MNEEAWIQRAEVICRSLIEVEDLELKPRSLKYSSMLAEGVSNLKEQLPKSWEGQRQRTESWVGTPGLCILVSLSLSTPQVVNTGRPQAGLAAVVQNRWQNRRTRDPERNGQYHSSQRRGNG